MKKLKESDVIEIMREEWTSHVNNLLEGLKVSATVHGDKQPVIAPELKVKHKSSGLLYTVDSVSMRDVILRTPEGELMHLNAKELEDDYEIS